MKKGSMHAFSAAILQLAVAKPGETQGEGQMTPQTLCEAIMALNPVVV